MTGIGRIKRLGGRGRKAARARAGLLALALGALVSARAPASAGAAVHPPMGWNSWDAYGFTIDEAQFKANAAWLARHRALGWSYAVIDEGWYMANPTGQDLATRAYRLDRFGRLTPDTRRFPSAADGRGLKALAAWTHAQGLKFGIHIVRGIPKTAVAADLPIAGSPFRASQAADRAATCPWDDANYGIADNAAGQAYYDALLRQYAGWGVDFLKVDCIADHPYRPTEIRQIGLAIRKAGRPMPLSLSPGPAQIAHADEMARWAQMWRIANDLWDGWTFPHPDPQQDFPQGVRSAFANLARWNPYVGRGHWPDPDMLPVGALRPHPGWGDPRQSRLTPAETRTAFTLWAIARAPLILGANLTELDEATAALLTDRTLIALDQEARTSRPVAALPASLAGARVWLSAPQGGEVDTVAVFNVSDAPLRLDTNWAALGVPSRVQGACEIGTGAAVRQPEATIAPHDVALFRLAGSGAARLPACPAR